MQNVGNIEGFVNIWVMMCPAAEFSMSICSIPNFICSSEDGVSRLLVTGSDTSYIKVTFPKTGWCEYYISLKLNL